MDREIHSSGVLDTEARAAQLLGNFKEEIWRSKKQFHTSKNQ